MKKIYQPLIFAGLFSLLLLTGCGKKSEFTVKGIVSAADGQTMYLEHVGISSVELLDSVKLNAAGKFKFTQKRPAYPDFYRLRLNNNRINFAIDSTEVLTFEADASTFATSYTVSGSENAKAIKKITLAQLDANQAISRLRKDHEAGILADSTYTKDLQNVALEYKEVALNYIFKAPMSTAAYFALFQQIDGLLFFDLYDKEDSRAYGAVATSYDHYYPESPRAQHLHNLALQSLKVIRGQRSLDIDQVNIQEVNFLDIELPNEKAEIVKLSSIAEGHTAVINFTAYMSEWSPALNMALGECYTKFKDKGLVIYQVSLDADAHFWRNAAANLPWITVRDPESVYSQIAALYNVKQLPALFILDKKGNMVKRVEDFTTLENDIKAAL